MTDMQNAAENGHMIPVYRLTPLKAQAAKVREQSTLRITASGTVVDLLEPQARQIKISDIAEGLSKICRYTGHTAAFYSVAQHCCITHDLVPPAAKPYALLHDAHEAYIGDLPTPLLAALGALGALSAIDTIKDRLDRAILDRQQAVTVPQTAQDWLARMDM